MQCYSTQFAPRLVAFYSSLNKPATLIQHCLMHTCISCIMHCKLLLSVCILQPCRCSWTWPLAASEPKSLSRQIPKWSSSWVALLTSSQVIRYIGSRAVQFWCWLDAVSQSHISNWMCKAAQQQPGLSAAASHMISMSNKDFRYMADALGQLYLNAFCPLMYIVVLFFCLFSIG